MAILPIVRAGNPVLREKAKRVRVIDKSIHKLIEDMWETMYDAPGVGLAAPQIGVGLRVVVIDVGDGNQIALVNPEIVKRSGERIVDEGCLSVPSIYELVERAERVKVRAYDQNGTSFTLEAQGLLAVCIQHEMDHLKGKVFIEHLSQLKQQRIRAKLAKQLRKTA